MKDLESHLIFYIPFPKENVITYNKSENKNEFGYGQNQG